MNKINKENRLILILIFILIIPAFFTNIKKLTLLPDESLRSLVAIEMKLSGDYITPTLGNVHYYKKPPVFNWIIASYFTLTNDYSELATRIPMLLSLLFYALSIYWVAKNRYGLKIGIISALLFILYPRIIVYESLYGLIDMTYSWVVFITYISIYKYFKDEKYLSLFLISYFLTGVSFLMKGIPSIAYQGITLFLIFTLNKKFKKLFSWQHIVGVLPLFILLGAYYYAYYLRNPENIIPLLTTIFNESADKSAIAYGFWDIVLHSFTFTGEIIYNYLPGTLIILFFLKKKPFKFLKTDPFLKYLLITFVGNVSIYFISPTTYMRYVLPHVSLLIIAFTVYYYHYKNQVNSKIIQAIDIFFLVIVYILAIGQLAYAFVPQLDFISYKWIKAITLFGIIAGSTIWLQKKKQYRVELFIIALLVFKLGFNLFIIPSRTHNHYLTEMREKSLEIGEKLKGKKIHIGNNIVQTTHYYLTAGKGEIIPRSADTIDVDYVLGNTFPYDVSHKPVEFQYKVQMSPEPLQFVKWKTE